MNRSVAVGLAMAFVAAGCASKDQTTAHRQVDIDSIGDGPLPDIKPETYVAAGDLAATRNNFDGAAGQYEQALKAKPDDAATTRKLALAYVKCNKLPAAIDAWKRYLAASHGNDDAYGSLGYVYELSGKPVDAEKTYQAGVVAHPDGPLTHINYGLMLVRHNDVDAAVKQLSAVLKPPEVNYDIASVYGELGRRDLAQFYYKRALECDPGFDAARQKLTMLDPN